MKIIVFLQNAWSPVYAGRTWPRESWLRALIRSRSGQRLRHLLDDFSCCDNLTPIVGPTPDSVVPPDEQHIAELLRQAEVVVTCGRIAEETIARLWQGPLLALPHPACRVVTNQLYSEGKRLLASKFKSRVALRQRIGKFEQVPL